MTAEAAEAPARLAAEAPGGTVGETQAPAQQTAEVAAMTAARTVAEKVAAALAAVAAEFPGSVSSMAASETWQPLPESAAPVGTAETPYMPVSATTSQSCYYH